MYCAGEQKRQLHCVSGGGQTTIHLFVLGAFFFGHDRVSTTGSTFANHIQCLLVHFSLRTVATADDPALRHFWAGAKVLRCNALFDVNWADGVHDESDVPSGTPYS